MEELLRENKRLKQENQELRKLLQQVTERLTVAEEKIKQLSEQLGQNSRNSNWPSSRDKSRQKPKPKSLRQKTGRKAGGQKGHKGHTLAINPEPDVIERQLLADLFELPISTGSLQNFLHSAAEAVKPATEAIKAAIIKAEMGHADETGFYINGNRYWLHTVSTAELTYYEPHQNRGQKATDAIGILPQFSGTLVHDAWATYFKYKLLLHALCNAHHLRDLTAIVENDQQQWAALMITCLLSAKQLVDEAWQAGETELPNEYLQRIHQMYDAIVVLGLEENPLPDIHPPPKKRGRRKKTKSRNLVERFEKHKVAILRFVHDFKVPFDNNLAERDIRMMKVQQKVSGCFRSWQGAKHFCSLRTYISTIRKQGLNVWEALGSLFDGDVLMPQLTPV